MIQNKLFTKLLLVAAGLCMGTSAWGQSAGMKWSAIYTTDFTNAVDVSIWTSANTGRYTVAQYDKGGGDMAVESVPVSNGNNGTTIDCTKIGSLGTDYTKAAEYKVEFDFNFCTNDNQKPWFDIYNASGTVIVAFSADTEDIKVNGTKVADFTAFTKATRPTTFHHVEITANATDGTNLKFTPAGGVAATYKISDDVVYVGKLTHNTKRYYNHFVFDNLGVYKAVSADEVQKPTMAITAVNGNNRTVTMSHEDGDAIIYYTTDDGANWTKYTAPVVVGSTTTFKAKATKNAAEFDTLTDSDFSDITDALEVTAGVGVTLAGVSITRTAENTYTLSTDQMAILCTPNPTIHYALDGVEKGTYVGTAPTASTSVTIDGYGEVSAWATADGYTESATATLNAIATPVTSAVWTVDLNAYGNNESSLNYTTDAAAIDGDYKALLNGDNSETNNNFRIQESDAWLLRNANRGLKAQNGSSGFGFYNVKKDQYIIIRYAKEGTKGGFSVASGSATEYLDFGGTKIFKVTADDDVKLNVAVGTTTTFVGVYDELISVTVSAAGMATYVNSEKDLDFTSATIKAYTAEVTAKGVCTLTEVAKVPAGTPVLLVKDGGASENIPVTTGAPAVGANDLVAGTGAAVATIDGSFFNMILNNVGGNVGFYFAAGQTVAANRAYLHFDESLAPDKSSNAPMMMVFADEMQTTGINDVKGKLAGVNGSFFDLQGRKVANPTKGLYIVNGKKIAIR